MNNQTREIKHYYEHIHGDVLQFIKTLNNRPVVVFGRLNQRAPILQLAAEGMDIYKQTVRRCAPEFDTITTRTEKTAYLSGMVTRFINEGFLFVERDGDNYFQYNMVMDDAFVKVRGKVRQAMKDFLRKKKKAVLFIPEISVVRFLNEGPILPGKDLMNVFDDPLVPEIEQVLDNMNISSEGGAYDLDEVEDEEMDDLSFSDFPMMD